MILDCYGRPLTRAIGFIGGYVPVRKAGAPAGALYAVGFEMAEIKEDEEEDEEAAPAEQMRR